MRANPPNALRDVVTAQTDPAVRWNKRRDGTRHFDRRIPYPLPVIPVSIIEVRFNPMTHECHARFT